MTTLPLNLLHPTYVADEARLRANLAVLDDVRRRGKVDIVYAIKACPLLPIFPIIAEVLDGSTSSGLYEARLGLEGFGSVKPLHVFCPAYTDEEVGALLGLGAPVHFYFNSLPQLARFAPRIRQAGARHRLALRINPALSLTQLEKYDPCRAGSHLGVPCAQLDAAPWELIDTLHVHALCENQAEDSARLIDHVSTHLERWLPRVRAINFGGGHYMTHVDYNLDILIAALTRFAARWPQLTRILEPGAAVVHEAGVLVGRVLGVVENEGVRSAILNISPNCHIPDVIKIGLRMAIDGAAAADAQAYTYTLTGRTCMARDIWGEYSFDKPLQEGDAIVIRDALQYSLGEANWFNGHPRPAFGLLRQNGDYQPLREFSYDDFRISCGAAA